MNTVTLKRKGIFLVVDPHGPHPNVFYAEFRFFDAICRWISDLLLKRPLSEAESINVQAMLGANSIKGMTIGPGARMRYMLESCVTNDQTEDCTAETR